MTTGENSFCFRLSPCDCTASKEELGLVSPCDCTASKEELGVGLRMYDATTP